jgi:PIN domain nuclease of toxin-antitoxin system
MGRLVLILLDTHVVIWLAQDQDRISSRARDAITDTREGGQGLAVSSMTLLELARLASQKRIELTPNLEAFLRDVERRFAVLPITGRICVQAFEFPANYPKDPADRNWRYCGHRRTEACNRRPSDPPVQSGANNLVNVAVLLDLSLSPRICLNQTDATRARRLGSFHNRDRHSLPHSSGSRRRIQVVGNFCRHVPHGRR